jgi:hypothetical protein
MAHVAGSGFSLKFHLCFEASGNGLLDITHGGGQWDTCWRAATRCTATAGGRKGLAMLMLANALLAWGWGGTVSARRLHAAVHQVCRFALSGEAELTDSRGIANFSRLMFEDAQPGT